MQHRPLFPLASIEPNANNPGSNPRLVEKGFIGAHSDIGGGYQGADLSDVTLQWMIDQANKAGVPINISNLNPAQRTITNPVVHDERGGLGKLFNADRAVESPNDPNWVSTQQALNSLGGGTTQNNNVFQRSDPDYQTLKQFIRSDGTVDINAYKQWLQQQRGFTLQK